MKSRDERTREKTNLHSKSPHSPLYKGVRGIGAKIKESTFNFLAGDPDLGA
jgi:hypothetical protein